MTTSDGWKAGLEDVVATRSAICRVDGEQGRLFFRGYEIGDLAAASTFEDVTYLLWFGELPDASAAAEHRRRLAETRGLPKEIRALLEGLPRDVHVEHFHAAVVGRQQAEQRLEHRALARAVRPEEAVDLTRTDLDVE